MAIFSKCYNYTRATEVKEKGYYPYFKAIQSGADTEVIIDGKKMIMIGSNTYLGLTQTPIVPLIFGEDMVTFGFWNKLFEQSVFSNPVISPAVPPDGSLIRTSYMATHTDKELDKVLEICHTVGQEMNLL